MDDPQKEATIRRMIDLADAIAATFHEDDTVHVIAGAAGMALADEAADAEDALVIASAVVSSMRNVKVRTRLLSEQDRAQDEADQLVAGTHR